MFCSLMYFLPYDLGYIPLAISYDITVRTSTQIIRTLHHVQRFPISLSKHLSDFNPVSLGEVCDASLGGDKGRRRRGRRLSVFVRGHCYDDMAWTASTSCPQLVNPTRVLQSSYKISSI